MKTKTLFITLVILILALVPTMLAAAQDTAPAEPVVPAAPVYPPGWNVVQNPGFEDGGSNPDSWDTQSYLPGAVFQWVSNQSVAGSKSVKIVMNSANDARWLQLVGVMENTDYVLSGWIKTQNVAHTNQSVDAGANLSILGLTARTPALIGTNDWTYVSVPFNSGNNTELFVYARLGYFSGTTTGTAWFDDIRLVPLRRLYLSSSQSGTVAGIPFAPGDILSFTPDTGEWAMYFDAGDVGLKHNVAAFAFTEEGYILMSLSAAENVPGAGYVRPQDVVLFQATSTGPDTAGTFSRFVDGRAVGLSKAGEKIDALTWLSGWYMDVSTTGALDVKAWDGTPIKARDEDMTEAWMYYGYFDGWETMTFDGSAVPGLAAEDVTASYFDAWSWCWFLTIEGSGVIDGHAYDQKDIFMVQDGVLLGRYWNGPANGFNYPIDGIDITEW